MADLGQALQQAGHRLTDGAAEVEITLGPVARDPAISPLDPRHRSGAYTIRWTDERTLAVAASDDAGLMYGCLDLAEQLAMGVELGSIVERDAAPALAVRGLYTFLHSDAAEPDWLHDPVYWQRYADELARCRFNRFNLIYGHQTAYLIPMYTHLLDDLDEQFPEIRAAGITAEERTRNLAALRTASAAMAGRGLTFFLGIWSSRPWTVENGVWETQPTRVVGTDDLARLAAYTRAGFSRLIERCPDIGGIQLRMNIESGVADQRFFVRAFAPALADLAARGRRLIVELRNWGLHPETVEGFRRTGLDIVVSTKYFAEHQGLPYQPPAMRESYSYDSFLRTDKPFPFQWHLWNLGSHRLFAWGDPDYARRFARSCRLGDGIGFEVTPPGSQKGFSQWGQVGTADWRPRRDLPARWDFERYWFFHLAFGRMGYDPTTGYDLFVHQLARRTSPEAAPALLSAYRSASQVISYLVSMRMDDPNMYVWPELDCGGPIDHNAIAPPGDATLFATAREHAEDRVAGRGSAKVSPFAAAADLQRFASGVEEALAQVSLEPMASLADNVEFRTIETDFGALRALARYHASKCRATGNLALFHASGERRFLDAAETDAESGVRRWEELCARTEVYHDALHFGPSGGHWRDNRPRVQYDVRRVRRVRELFDVYGLFLRGFDFGQALPERVPPRAFSGLEPEPRFVGVDAATAYTPERGFGWLQTGGLRAVGFSRLPRDLLWGVHFITPDAEYDPASIEAMPLDGLTERYLTASVPRTFRVDVPDGEYEVTLLAPRQVGLAGAIQLNGTHVGAPAAAPTQENGHGDAAGARSAVPLGSIPAVATVRANVTVTTGAILVTLGGDRPWAIAGLMVRPLAPLIAHLPAPAVRAGLDLTVTATATAADPIRSVVLRYRRGAAWEQRPMDGDGAAFRAVMPAGELEGESFEYELIAEDDAGQVTRHAFAAPIVRGFRPPRVVGAVVPNSWSSRHPLSVTISLEEGEFAREVRLHYREADQSRDFRLAALPGGRSGEYAFQIDTTYLDDAYELLVYVEVVDVLDGGTFSPDPFFESRYLIVKPA
jgi:hypothetical protein